MSRKVMAAAAAVGAAAALAGVAGATSTPRLTWSSGTVHDAVAAIGLDGRAVASPATGADPAWSRDGRLAVATADGLRVVGGAVVAPSGAAQPAWSPDGARIAYVRDGALYTVRVDGSVRTRVARAALAAANPSWSPDGRRIAFDGAGARDRDVYVVDADGTRLHAVASVHGADDFGPAWSPDGTHVAFASDRRHARDAARCSDRCDVEVWLARADGSAATRLTDAARDVAPETGLTWSPDGRFLAYGSFDRGLVVVLPARGGAARSFAASVASRVSWTD